MQKPWLLTLCFLLIASVGISQFSNNDKLLSVTVAPYPTESLDQEDFGIIVKADMEIFLANRLSLVTSAFYSSNTAFKNASGLSLNAYGIVPSLQYYILNKERLSLNILAGYGFGFTDRTINTAQNSAMTIVTLGAGITYKVSERLYAKLQIPYFKAQNISFDFTEVEGAAPFIGLSYRL